MSGNSAPSGFRCRSDDKVQVCVASAARAARGDMAHHVVDEIHTRLCICPGLAFRLETALHEAIANVTVHGALEAPGFERTGVDSLRAQQLLLNERLADPRYAERDVEVSISIDHDRIELKVSGPGPGFDVSRAHDCQTPQARTRGLSLIANLSDIVTYTNGGRTVVLVFFLQSGTPAEDPAHNTRCGGQE